MLVPLKTCSLYKQAFTGEAIFGTANESKPILATEGVRTCICFAGRNPEQGIGFLAHFMGPKQVDHFFKEGLEKLLSMAQKSSTVFECVLMGGSKRSSASKEIIEKIKTRLGSAHGVEFRIVHEEEPSKTFEVKNISFDLRDGTIGSYDSSNDPSPREKTQEYETRCGTRDIFERLYYPEIECK